MKHRFTKPSSVLTRGNRAPDKGLPPDPFITQLLADCGTTEEIMPDDIARGYLLSWHQTGDERDLHKILKGNMRLVLWTAHRFTGPNVHLSDLVQEGSIGFDFGLRRYDLSQTGRVATYANMWARNKILLYIEQHSRTVHLQRRTLDMAKKGLRELEKLVMEYEHNGVTLDYVVGEVFERGPAERVGVLDAFGNGQSLDAPRRSGDDEVDSGGGSFIRYGGSQIAESLQGTPPPGAPDAAGAPGGDEAAERIELVCRNMPEDTRSLVYAYYGLDGKIFSEECERLNLETGDGRVVVTRALSQLRGQLAAGRR